MQKDLIQKQINQLCSNPCISDLSSKEQNSSNYLSTIDFIFTISGTQTIYDNYPFSIRVNLPQRYPQQPPKIFFSQENIIYHLNVNQSSGQLILSAIKDDWSQFLSLSTIAQVLESSLIEPDITAFANKEIMIQYKHRIDNYWAKAEKNMQQLRNNIEKKQNLQPKSDFDSPRDLRKIKRNYTQPDNQQSDFTFSKNYFTNLSQQQQQKIIRQQVSKISHQKNHNNQLKGQFQNSKTQKNYYRFNETQQKHDKQTLKDFISQENIKKNAKLITQNYQIENKNQLWKQQNVIISKQQKNYTTQKIDDKHMPKYTQRIQEINQDMQKRAKGSFLKQSKLINKREISQISQTANSNNSAVNGNRQQYKISNQTSVLQEKLKRAISTLNIFTQQCLTIQEKLKTASHPKLRQILQSQLEQQIDDIQQISQVVTTLKKNLIRKVKLDGIVN